MPLSAEQTHYPMSKWRYFVQTQRSAHPAEGQLMQQPAGVYSSIACFPVSDNAVCLI